MKKIFSLFMVLLMIMSAALSSAAVFAADAEKTNDDDLLANAAGKKSTQLNYGDSAVNKLDEANAVVMNVHSGYMYYNKNRIKLDSPAVIKNGRTLVPMRAVSEAFGCDVSWNDETKTASVNGVAEVTIGSSSLKLTNGASFELDVPAEIISSRTMLPLRALCENVLKKEVAWNDRGIIVVSDGDLELSDEDFRLLDIFMLYENPSAESLKSDFEAKKSEHPRIILNSEKLSKIKSDVDTYDFMAKWKKDTLEKADSYMNTDVCKYEIPDGLRLLATSRDVLSKAEYLAMAYHLTGDEKYVQRLWQDIESAGNFKDWNHTLHFLDTGEMTAAFAIAYDWLYDEWTDEQKAFMEEAIRTHGLQWAQKALYGIGDFSRFYVNSTENWNIVCNGGTAMGAMAVFDKYPDLCADILEKSLVSSEQMMTNFFPDGAWHEGVGYWDYLMEYVTFFDSSLKNTFGSDYNLFLSPGLEKSGEYFLSSDGMTSSNNFHDAGEGRLKSAYLYYLSDVYNQPGLTVNLLNKMNNLSIKGSPIAMIFCNTAQTSSAAEVLPLDEYFRDTEIVSMRSSWDDEKGVYVSWHTGKNNVGHAHLDEGTFVADLGGQRFACDIGAEDYNIGEYFGGLRYSYYRTRPEGHNTLVINPTSDPGQNRDADCKIDKFVSKAAGAYSTSDVTDAYKGMAESVKRGIMLGDYRRSITVRDEIKGLAEDENEIYWFMHVQSGKITVKDSHTAEITKGGVTVNVRFVSDADTFELTAAKAEPLASSPVMEKQNKNTNYSKLSVKMTAKKDVYIQAKISVLGDHIGDTAIIDTPIDSWEISDGEIPVMPTLPMIYADGEKIEAFNPESDRYTLVYAHKIKDIPKITFDNPSNYKTEIKEAEDAGSATEIKVTDLQHPDFYRVYRINFKSIPSENVIDEQTGMTRLMPESVTVSDNPQLENREINAFDENVTTRWAVEGKNHWMICDMGEPVSVEAIGLKFWKSSERKAIYALSVSDDGENWTKIFDGESTLHDDDTYEMHSFDTPQKFRFIKLDCNGTNTGLWFSLLEFAFLKK